MLVDENDILARWTEHNGELFHGEHFKSLMCMEKIHNCCRMSTGINLDIRSTVDAVATEVLREE